jgi:hypothetical protein
MSALRFLFISAALCFAATGVHAQRGQPAGPALPPQQAAPVDLTGQWVSLVTEDWRWRMMAPPRGDVSSIPVNAEARKIAQAWDPQADEKAGERCRAFGAPALLRIPGRIRIAWENLTTVRLDADAGTQTRRFHFGTPPEATPSLQGRSAASWTYAGGRAPRGGGPPRGGAMKVITTGLRPGYLRRNGVPYSAETTLTEYFNRVEGLNGDSYLIVTTVVTDPRYLNQPFITSTHFRLETDQSRWSPTPCSTT